MRLHTLLSCYTAVVQGIFIQTVVLTATLHDAALTSCIHSVGQ